MVSAPQHVVILYAHPLLGEGVAQMLGIERGIEVELVDVEDSCATSRALAGSPDVVILERNSRVQAIDLLREAPAALFIDVGLDAGPTWAYRRDELSDKPASILDAIHRRRARRSPVIC